MHIIDFFVEEKIDTTVKNKYKISIINMKLQLATGSFSLAQRLEIGGNGVLCCQSDVREQRHYGFMSFITSCGGQGRLIWAGKPQAQCEAAAGEQPTGSIKGPN